MHHCCKNKRLMKICNVKYLKKVVQPKLGLSLLFLIFSTYSIAQLFEGIVYIENTSNPVPYAKVVFLDADISVLANDKGKFNVTNISSGTHRVEVSALGYETKITTVLLKNNTLVQLAINESHRQLDKVIVSNNGFLQRENVTNVEAHKLTDLTAIPVTSIGEAIANIPGVSQTGIGVGIRKPVVRGLTGSRVVTYVNSLRIQNQQWGGDHGLPVTSLGIGDVEVIKGPASLLYGADALGGVLYFIDQAYAPQNEYQVVAQSRFDHNSLGTSNELGVKWSKKALKINAFAGYDNFADYGIPNGKQVLNSRFKQTSAKLAIGYNRKHWVANIRYNFLNGRIGLPGHTHDTIINPASFQTTNQKRKNNVPAQVVQNHFVALENNFFFQKNHFYFTVGHTLNRLNEYEEKISFPAILMDLNNTLINLKWKHIFTEKLKLIVGTQGMHQVNLNQPDAEELLIPNASSTDIGLYSLLSANYKKWTFQAGARVDNRQIDGEKTGDKFGKFEAAYQGYNYSIGGVRSSDITTARINISSGFRAPTTSELLSNGVHHGSFRYEVGSTNLIPEKATQFDASLGFHFEDLEIIINPFYSFIDNYIYLQEKDTTIGQFVVYQYKQAKTAQLYGVDAGFHYHPHGAHWLHIESNITNVFAEDNQNQPLPLIPQTRLNTQLRFELNTKTKFKCTAITVQHLFFFKQNRVGPLESNTSAYQLLNIGANFKVDSKNPLTLSVGARNLLNTPYINHLSGLKGLGIQNPGVNFYLSVNYQFKNKLKSN